MASLYQSIEVDDAQLLLAIAQEAAIDDRDLDAIEAQLPAASVEEALGLALTLGRAGRPSSRGSLQQLHDRIPDPGLRCAIRLAMALLSTHPEGVEQAESGYRFSYGSDTLFLEDPLAAHWHGQGRWGPPLRPDLERAAHVAQFGGFTEALGAALEGRAVIVTFRREPWQPPVAPLRLSRCGFSRDPTFRAMVRWSQIRSLGKIEGEPPKLACETSADAVIEFPENPSIPTAELSSLMERLLKQARS